MIKFKVDYGDDVYLVYDDARGTKEELDKEVADGHGLHMSVPDNADQIYEFDTTNLQAGLYRIFPLQGSGQMIELINP
ncbi:hypothetical protein [Paenibacillus lutrae]|uniref:Uncharacterized protein n=1 Tax=Paenibacillus lutrae TaxID=2078573 RepID=A0A7X3FER2_9BACL|nr:hypothetical protein [Paenibacillus lutrae]MVO98274.1 hypothetical protein [Paenibacillus lutrae]